MVLLLLVPVLLLASHQLPLLAALHLKRKLPATAVLLKRMSPWRMPRRQLSVLSNWAYAPMRRSSGALPVNKITYLGEKIRL